MLQWMKDQSKRRRLLLSEQFGVQEGDQLCRVLGTEDERDQLYFERTNISPGSLSLSSNTTCSPTTVTTNTSSSTSSISTPITTTRNGGCSLSLALKRPAANNLVIDISAPTFAYSSSQKFIMTQSNHLGLSTLSSLSDGTSVDNTNYNTNLDRNIKSLHSRNSKRKLAKLELEKQTAKSYHEQQPQKQQQQLSSSLLTHHHLPDQATTNQDDEDDSKYEYKGSSAFLKGTQSANPHNDYCQHYVDTGQRPQNFIRDYELHDRFEEYPKLKELIKLKDELIAKTATPPMYLKCDLRQPNYLRQLDCKFDVILIDPPLEEYQRTQGVTKSKFWSWESLMHLEIEEIAAPRSFIFLWCGSSDGLDLGRKCLRKWGFRRCEDICWIKTNKRNIGHNKNLEAKAIFQRTKEHCLMGIKGTVRRSTDGDFIHSNVDIDLIISEEPSYGSYAKPEEIFHIIEHFCLGRRRLHLFGRDSTIRPGWLTVGPDLTNSNFNVDLYKDYFSRNNNDYLTGCTDRIEALRPKSPPPKGPSANNPALNNIGPHMAYRKRF